MKRNLLSLFICLLLFSTCVFFGCGENTQSESTSESTTEEATTTIESEIEVQNIAFNEYTYSVPKDATVKSSDDKEDLGNYGTTSIFGDYVVKSFYINGSPDTVEEAVGQLYPEDYSFKKAQIGNGINGLIATRESQDTDGRRMYIETFCTVSNNVFYELEIWSYNEDLSEVEGIVFDSLR